MITEIEEARLAKEFKEFLEAHRHLIIKNQPYTDLILDSISMGMPDEEVEKFKRLKAEDPEMYLKSCAIAGTICSCLPNTTVFPL